jgi:esterase/lipase superfamily enzyme
MQREYGLWRSPALGRDMEYLVFGHAGTPVLVFPTRMGRFWEYERGGMVEALRHHLDSGWLRLYCVDSVDNESLYCDWRHPRDRIRRHLDYERYILDEMLPYIRHCSPCGYLMVHGCSLGAFHAVNIALRHPGRFDKVVALSGRYNLCEASAGFGDLFGGYYDDEVYFNTPSHYLPGIRDDALLNRLRRLEIVLAVGADDPFLPNTLAFSEALWNQGIWHARHIWPGRAHDFRHWRAMATILL